MRHNTDWNKELKDPEQYASNWDWTVAHSEYHFDNSIQDKSGDWFDVLGRFDNPKQWLAERDVLVEASKPVNWATRKYFGDTDDESPMLAQEEYDIEQGGGNPKDLMLTNIVDDWSKLPTLYNMMDYFGLEVGGVSGAKKRAHVQLTGQMFNLHIDKLWDRCIEDPERVARITIMLDDWQPGQFYMYGNYVYSHWSAGEAHIFDWANVPHATANASNTPRATLQVTGLKTDKTRYILNNATPDKVYKLA
tara:strand:+ start:1696 stop:2442 length:747 start_codon:yes stop_codon:yes gene_type:complete